MLFRSSLVRAVVPKSDHELERMLNGLQLGEFIYEQPAVRESEYIFKHARTQEVAYNSVLQERRNLMHERIGGALETLYANSLDDHLAELRRDGISYIFAGIDDVDLVHALVTLRNEFAIERLLLEGGGGINGAFLAARLIDEVSLLLMPVADGAEGTPTLFDRIGGSVRMLKLRSVTRLEEGILHLRYQVT